MHMTVHINVHMPGVSVSAKSVVADSGRGRFFMSFVPVAVAIDWQSGDFRGGVPVYDCYSQNPCLQ